MDEADPSADELSPAARSAAKIEAFRIVGKASERKDREILFEHPPLFGRIEPQLGVGRPLLAEPLNGLEPGSFWGWLLVGLLAMALVGYFSSASNVFTGSLVNVQSWFATRFTAVQDFLTAPRDMASLQQRNT